MKLVEFSTLGSCASRMIFNEKFTPGYKNFAHINFSVEGGSLISLMSNPVKFDKTLLTASKPFDNRCVENDFSKKYLTFLKTNKIDYILMDTYFDLSKLILLNNGSYVTNSARLRRTKLYENLEIDKKINIYDDIENFFQLWKKACDSFFDFLEKNSKNTKIILNCSRLVYKYKDDDGNIKINKNFRKRSYKHNAIRDMLESYLLKNYDIDVLFFNENTLLDKNHVYGFEPSHYSSDFYPETFKQIIRIINRNNYFNDYYDEINIEIRKLKRDNILLNFEKNKFTQNLKKQNTDNSKNISFCPICGNISIFDSFGVSNRKNAQCPKCKSLERHRLVYLLLQNNYKNLFNKNKVKLLHFSPETVFYNYFKSLNNIDYFPITNNLDKYRNSHLVKHVNFEKIPYEDNSFDIIYNNHVLHTVPNDINVLSEMHRVLKQNGICITSIPQKNIQNTIELNKYGQNNKNKTVSFREYGLDFSDKLKSIGFDVIEITNVDIVKNSIYREFYKLQSSGTLFICTK